MLQVVLPVLQDCDELELMALMSPINGIATVCSWPPTLYDFATFRKARRDKIIDKLNFDERYPSRPTFQPRVTGYREPFRPYPKLWAAFADEPEIIDRLDNKPPYPLMNFENLTEASRRNAMHGKDEAREYILSMDLKASGKLHPATQQKIDDGTWSSADLTTPPAPPRSKELRELAERYKPQEDL